jgi:ribosomal protein S18 acetylase RimI-like enzyme
MRVRPARLDDLPAVYRLCHQLGMPSGPEPRQPELLGHVYAGAYVVAPGTRSVVVVDELGVAGYLLCALDTVAFETWRDEHWWPGLRGDYPRELEGRSAADQEVVDLIHSPPLAPPDIAARYPAHLHIDLYPRLQGRGIGGRLIGALIDELAERGIHGLHLDVGSDNTGAIAFYRRLGFAEVRRMPDSILMAREIDPSTDHGIAALPA